MVATDSLTPITLVGRLDIERTPGADRTNSMAMITDYVPGAYVTHDKFHIRGGHQTTWLLDGIPVLNTAIAQNSAPSSIPKILTTWKSIAAAMGPNSATAHTASSTSCRAAASSGTTRPNLLSAGNFYQTNDSLSFGSHTERFAYYASVNGNRSDLGLQPPIPQVVHDAVNGAGGFGSLIFNVDPSNQLRLMTSPAATITRFLTTLILMTSRTDRPGQFHPAIPSIGLRDGDHEADAGVLFSWVHTFNSHLLTTVSPFYHYNSADYESTPNDYPTATTENRTPLMPGARSAFAPTTRGTICRLDSSASTSTIASSSGPSSIP